LGAKVVAFVNFKGGVGKTANVVNIGAGLAKYHGKRVLIVDLDAQSNSSLWLMQPPEWREHTRSLKKTVYQLFKDQIVGIYAGRRKIELVLVAVPMGKKPEEIVEHLGAALTD
jgi:chromosome partitioning protein